MPKAILMRFYLPTQIWHYGFLQRVYTRKWILNKIKTMVSPGTKVLDFGCGDSPHQNLVLANKGVYFGIDVKETKFGLVFDGIKAPFEDDSFDLITLEEVLPVAPDSSILIKECKRVLKPGGSLIVTSNFLFPMNGDKVVFQDGFDFDYYRFTEAGLKRLVCNEFEEVFTEQLGGLGSHLLMPQYFYRNFLMRNNSIWVRGFAFALAPVYLIFCTLLNILGLLINRIDTSKIFASDVVAVAKK
jgi:SAM-dependent methyltransferase